MSLYECAHPGCEWRNPDWRYGFGDAGASYHSHLAQKHDGRTKPAALFIGTDSAGDLYVWRETDGDPVPVLNFRDVTDDELWSAIQAYVGLKRDLS